MERQEAGVQQPRQCQRQARLAGARRPHRHDAGLAGPGETVYLDNCSACHAEDGTGDRFQGAPNLTDVIWLYGGSEDAIRYTVENARFGVMPPKGGAPLTEAQVRAVATYVHQLGGGE